jgi:hypothetical protein
MSRPANGLKYFKETLALNRSIYERFKTCIYINETDLAMMSTELEGLTIIPRTNHDEALNMFEKGSYPYWRSHLCADFIYCMSQAALKHPECDAFMWLEDDVLLHPNFESIWNSKQAFIWSPNGHGATCIMFTRDYLLNTVIPAIQQHYLEDIPLDWMYRFFVEPTRLNQTVAFHIGVESSQKNCTRPQNDWPQYKRLCTPCSRM